jgi:hypothetical protein
MDTLAFGGSRLLRALLFDAAMADVAVYLACAVPPWRAAASYLPARRATRVDLMAVLRAE